MKTPSKIEPDNFAETHPHLANEWHPTKNGNLVPKDVTAQSLKRIWWKCPKGSDHEWEARIYKRTRPDGTGCPFCAGQKVSSTNCLSNYPEIVSQLHPTKNGTLAPDKINAGSKENLWWKCSKGSDHEWKTQIINRTGTKGTGCPYCAGIKVSITNCLLNYPEVVSQLHPTKNGILAPDKINAGSNKKLWWQCSKDSSHEWEAQVALRTYRKYGCPYCSNRRLSSTNTLQFLYPDIAAQLHPTKNGSLVSDKINARAHKKLWWKCPKAPDHEWEAQVNSRTKLNGTGCPFCSGLKVSSINCLSNYPDIVSQLHPTKNGILVPEKINANSSKKLWWKCLKGTDHEWETQINSRTKLNGTGCPFCAGQKVSSTNCLLNYPDIVRLFHPTKNGTLTPDEILAKSEKKVWWKCPKSPDHEWETSPAKLLSGTRCPYCAGKKTSVTNSLASLFPAIARELHPTKNQAIHAENIIAGSNKKLWWQCSKDSTHEWEAQVALRTYRKYGCPYCSNRRLSSTNTLQFLYPDIAAQFHPAKNGNISAEEILAGCIDKFWWKCSQESDHEWYASVHNRTSGKTGCPFCEGLRPAASNSLASLFPDIAKEFHSIKNAPLTPDAIVAKSNKKMWWQCSKNPIHEWEAQVYTRST